MPEDTRKFTLINKDNNSYYVDRSFYETLDILYYDFLYCHTYDYTHIDLEGDISKATNIFIDYPEYKEWRVESPPLLQFFSSMKAIMLFRYKLSGRTFVINTDKCTFNYWLRRFLKKIKRDWNLLKRDYLLGRIEIKLLYQCPLYMDFNIIYKKCLDWYKESHVFYQYRDFAPLSLIKSVGNENINNTIRKREYDTLNEIRWDTFKHPKAPSYNDILNYHFLLLPVIFLNVEPSIDYINMLIPDHTIHWDNIPYSLNRRLKEHKSISFKYEIDTNFKFEYLDLSIEFEYGTTGESYIYIQKNMYYDPDRKCIIIIGIPYKNFVYFKDILIRMLNYGYNKIEHQYLNFHTNTLALHNHHIAENKEIVVPFFHVYENRCIVYENDVHISELKSYGYIVENILKEIN